MNYCIGMKQSVSASLTTICHENIKYAPSANFIRTYVELTGKKELSNKL